jgi:hypothetical protein
MKKVKRKLDSPDLCRRDMSASARGMCEEGKFHEANVVRE